MSLPRRFRVELVSRSDLSPRVQALRFRARQPLAWVAGQYVTLFAPDGGERFPYSIASIMDAKAPGEFELAVARGSSADVIEELAVGAELDAEGPQGELIWQPEVTESALLIGAGTGVAPLRALVHEELARDGSRRLVLLSGQRTESDVLWAEELGDLGRSHRRFSFEPTLSQPGRDWSGRRGRVQDHLAELVAAAGGAVFAYVCGQSAMVADVSALLRDRYGIAADRIRGEGH